LLFKKNIIISFIWAVAASASAQIDMAEIKEGSYTPLYGRDDTQVKVDAFLLDTHPVSVAEYLEFLKENPKWRKSQVKGIFADKNYLNSW